MNFRHDGERAAEAVIKATLAAGGDGDEVRDALIEAAKTDDLLYRYLLDAGVLQAMALFGLKARSLSQ